MGDLGLAWVIDTAAARRRNFAKPEGITYTPALDRAGPGASSKIGVSNR